MAKKVNIRDIAENKKSVSVPTTPKNTTPQNGSTDGEAKALQESVSAPTTPQYTNLRNGSSGSDVKKLQSALINAGYDLGSSGADGIYGNKTAAAVKAYQKANGLTIDGIAGNQTLGHLYSTKSTTPTTTPTPPASTPTDSTQAGAGTTPTATPSAPEAPKQDTQTQGTSQTPAPFTYEDFSYVDYYESDTVNQANALLQQHNANKPGAYQSQWQDEISDYLNQIENRDPFSYDFNSDALYQQYKDLYTQQGQMAMMDTMGQAAAMTGGYGNSYAQTVGQQAYNQQLSQLNNMMPELYQMAFDRYAYEGQQLQDMYNMYRGLEDQDYGRYMDSFNAWTSERDYLANQYNAERDYDYSKYEKNRALAYDEWNADRSLAYDDYINSVNMAYQQQRDAVNDAQWQAEYDEDNRRYEQNRADAQAAAEAAAAAKANSGSGNGNGSNWDNGSLSKDKVKEIQKALGVTVDGKWGDQSSKAAGGMTAEEAWEAYRNGDFEPEEETPTISDAAQKFMSHLPYAHAGSDINTWKGVVSERMMAQVDSGALTEEDAIAIINKLGL